MNLNHTQSYEYTINHFLHLMKSNIANVAFKYELLKESEFERDIDKQGFQVKSEEDVLKVLRIAKIHNGITISEIKKLRRDKGYTIGDDLFIVLTANQKK